MGMMGKLSVTLVWSPEVVNDKHINKLIMEFDK